MLAMLLAAVLALVLGTAAAPLAASAGPASATAGTATSGPAASAERAAGGHSGASSPGSSMHTPEHALLVRAAALTAAPGPTAPAGGLAPGDGPLVAPHLVGRPQARPPTAALAAGPAGAPSSRAPPGPAGT